MSNNFDDFGTNSYDEATSGGTDNTVLDEDLALGDSEEEETDGKPLSPKKLGIAAAIILMLIVVAILFIGRLSAVPKGESPAEVGTSQEQAEVKETTQPTETETLSNGENGGVVNGENTVETPEPGNGSSTSSGETTDVETTDVRKDAEVKSPVFKGEYSAGAFVTDRFVLKNGKQYQFVIEMTVSKGDSVTTLLYYAPKDSYDSVSIGDALKITYTSDQVGGVAIKTVTKP